jgi:RES domain-containing protein
MMVYRIAGALYKDDLSGEGARRNGARWNSKGIAMLYASEHISLCALEMLVNIVLTEIKQNFYLLHIALPEQASLVSITAGKLKKNWQEDAGYTHFIGDEFCKEKKALILKVPSAVIPDEYNFLLNPRHPDFKKVKIMKSKPFIFDKRLFLL